MPPEISSAPHTSARISMKYRRNSRPRCTRVISACCSLMASMGFSEPSPRLLYHPAHGETQTETLNLRGKNYLCRLFDHPIGPHEKRRRNREIQSACRLPVEHQLELRRLLDRQVGRLCALADAVDVARDAAVV